MQKSLRPQPRLSVGSVARASLKKKTPPPVLASEALREDLAPLEPARTATRVCHAAIAMVLLAVGFALRAGYGISGGSPSPDAICATAAALTAAAAAVPVGYRWRAVLGALIGLGVMAFGLSGLGPLALLGPHVDLLSWSGWRMLAAVALPATLLFRAHYRAYQRGRTLLVLAYLAAAPFLASEAALAIQGPRAVIQLSAGVTVLLALSGLFTLWGTPPVTVTVWLAGLFTLLVSLDVVWEGLLLPRPESLGPFTHTLTAVTFAGCASLAGLALFQLLAAVFARDARRVDVYRAPEPQPPVARPSSRD